MREVTADFGFSFAPNAIPIPIPFVVPQAPINEPPTKRRKIAPDSEAKSSIAPASTGSVDVWPPHDACLTAHQPPQAPERISGIGVVESIQPEEAACTASPKREAATVVIMPKGPTPGRSHSQTQDEIGGKAQAAEAKPEPKAKPTARGKKATKKAPKQTTSPHEATEDVDDSFVVGLKTRSKPKRQRKAKANDEVQQVPLETVAEQLPEVRAVAETKKPSSSKRKAIPIIDAPPMEPMENVDASQPAKAQDSLRDNSRALDQAEAVTVGADLSNDTKKPRARKKATDEPSTTAHEEPSQQSSGRPKRQAARSAVERVAMGFEEESGSVDKLRRAPEPANPVARGCKRGPPPAAGVTETKDIVSAAREPGRKQDMDQEFAPKRKGRKKQEATLAVPLAPAAELPPAPSPNKRKREEIRADDFADELSAAAEQPKAKRGRKAATGSKSKTSAASRPRKTRPDSTPLNESWNPPEHDNTADAAKPPPKKRSRKASASHPEQVSSGEVATCSNARLGTIQEVSEVHHTAGHQEKHRPDDRAQPSTDQYASGLTKATRPKTTSKAKKLESAVDETILLFTPKKRRALAETDVNRVSLSPDKATQADNENAPKKRKKGAQPDLQPTATKSIEEPTKSRSCSKEDIDWLFSTSPPRKLPPKSQRRQQQGEKKPRLRFADRACKDMDLDDLLESVAAF